MTDLFSDNTFLMVLLAVVAILQVWILVRMGKKTRQTEGQWDRLLEAIDERQYMHRREVRTRLTEMRQRNQVLQDNQLRTLQQEQWQVKDHLQGNLQKMLVLQTESKNEQQNAQATLKQRLVTGLRHLQSAQKLADTQLQKTLQRSLASISEQNLKNLHRLQSNLQSNVKDMLSQQAQGVITLQKTLADELERLRKGNEERLGKIEETVSDKLEKTLSERLTNSFHMVDNKLALVQKSLGEMQVMAQSVRDLKGVLTNVKTRGNFGEVQLEYLLSQLLHPSQFAKQFQINPETKNMVDFAIRLPGRVEGEDCWLPVDSKFPTTAFERLMRAQEKGDSKDIANARKELGKAIEKRAKSIQEKYIVPGRTTDFAILYLPSEALYAEVLRIDGLFELLQEKFHITPAGPTVIGALLNSLQMGFVTLAVEKRSGEIWRLMGDVKAEFTKFTDEFDKFSKLMDSAYKGMGSLKTRNNVMSRKMKAVDVARDVSHLFAQRASTVRSVVSEVLRLKDVKTNAS